MTIIKLPEKFNEYDPETLKHLQDVYLMMLKDFIKVCDENQIEYFLDGGSALGAVRHQGFIPWDDDIDVGMMRDDYEIFIRVVEREMGDKYQILTPEIDKRYACNVTKFQRKGTKFVSHLSEKLECEQCIFIDIFPFDCVAPTVRKAKRQQLRTLFLDRLLYLCGTAYPIIPYTGVKHAMAAGICWCVHYATKILRVSPKKIYQLFEKESKRYNREKTGVVTTFGEAISLRYRLPFDRMLPIEVIPFENVTINVLNNNIEHLEKTYGDYMKMPPLNQRVNHAPYIIEFGDE